MTFILRLSSESADYAMHMLKLVICEQLTHIFRTSQALSANFLNQTLDFIDEHYLTGQVLSY